MQKVGLDVAGAPLCTQKSAQECCCVHVNVLTVCDQSFMHSLPQQGAAVIF